MQDDVARPHANLPDLPPARYGHAFVVTYGRSGSTLLQGVLNAIPGYLVRGENWDMMQFLERIYPRLPRCSVIRGSSGQKPSLPTNPFFGFEHFEDRTYVRSMQLFVDNLLLQGADTASVRCLGFKEIRYTAANLDAKVAFLRTIFPACALIYNVRNPADVVASEFQKDRDATEFEVLNAKFAELSANDPDACLVRYEDVARGTGSLLKMFDFLGEPFDRPAIEAVLSVKHSFHKKSDGQIYSDVPRHIQMNKNLGGVAFMVTDRFEEAGGAVRISGLMLPREDVPLRRFRRVLDGTGKPVKFKASQGMPSPRLAEKLGDTTAGKARFLLTFQRESASEHRVFFDDGELALVVREASPEAAAAG